MELEGLLWHYNWLSVRAVQQQMPQQCGTRASLLFPFPLPLVGFSFQILLILIGAY